MSTMATATTEAGKVTRLDFISKGSAALVGALALQMLRSKAALAYCVKPFGCNGPGGCCNCSSYNPDNGRCCWLICVNHKIYECCDFDEPGSPTCQCRFYGGYGC